jgi:hypothetical protein
VKVLTPKKYEYIPQPYNEGTYNIFCFSDDKKNTFGSHYEIPYPLQYQPFYMGIKLTVSLL